MVDVVALVRSAAWGLAALGMAALCSGCVSERSPEEQLYADVEDPDPDKDPGGPKFCNPTGKQGEELRQCYEFNEAIYKKFDEEAKAREPWFNFTPDSWVTSKELDARYVVSVVKESEAVAKLEQAPVVELTADEVQQLAGRAVTIAGLKPYLVRGLYYYRDAGAFTVFEKDQAILVRHDSNGKSTPRETRSALIVYLGFKPKELYVDCQVTE